MRTASVREAGSRGAWVKGCGVCRRSYDADAWQALTAVETLPEAAVQAHLSVPVGFSIVLRRCLCGALLAARAA
jgi:hypothetical protein